MPTGLVTGGSGFLGSLLVRRLLDEGWGVVNIDLEPGVVSDPRLESKQGDIRRAEDLRDVFGRHRYNAVFHCAAILAHGGVSRRHLWTSNVDGARMVAEGARDAGVPNFVYVSSNCLWGESLQRPVREDDPPNPVELYGKSKWEGERLLKDYSESMNIVSIRCPTIIDEGRLGLLSILFEFIDEGRRVWVVGDGSNKYQFIYAQDVIDAMLLSVRYGRSSTFGIGSDDVTSMRDAYGYVIEQAGTKARVATSPKGPTLLAMRMAHMLKVSPLGPYQYKMIAEDFSFDTTAIKRELGWRPTLSNRDMLLRAYRYYSANRKEIERRENVSAHRKPAKKGIIEVLKWMS